MKRVPPPGRAPASAASKTKPAIMTLLEHLAAERICELIDLSGLLAFEQELWQALIESGVPRAEAPIVSAGMLARAFARFGEEHVKRASEDDPDEAASTDLAGVS